MSTAVIESKPESQTILFSVTEATVKPMAEKYLALTINGVDDKDGLAAVRAARQDVRKARTTVDNEREAAKRYYLEEGRKIDGAAKKLWAMIEPVESHLVAELERIDTETERIETERLDNRLADRNDALDEVGGIPSIAASAYPQSAVRSMDENRFKAFLVEMKEMNERLAAEARERAEAAERNRIEQEKLAAERAELERQRVAEQERQKAEQARLDEERRVENERLAAERAAEQKIHDERLAEERRVAAEAQKRLDEQAAAQKAESDRIAAEQKKLDDARLAKEQADEAARVAQQQAEAAESKRIADEKHKAAMMPHRDKILAYRDALMQVELPKLPQKLAKVTALIESLQQSIDERLVNIAEGLERA